MADTLKPCPFCGNEPTIRIFEGKDGWRDRYAVICRYDEGGCGAESGLYHYQEEAVYAWNRRESLWRNAEQDPPEENTPVLCYAVSTAGEGHFKVIGVLRNEEFWFLQVNDARWSSFPNMQLRVTHWQPLPNDPEEE